MVEKHTKTRSIVTMSVRTVRICHFLLFFLLLAPAARAEDHNWTAISSELDAQVEQLYPGFVEGLEENYSDEVIRFNGEDYERGSYEWCNSDASDSLCDSEWNDLCGHFFDVRHRGAAQKRRLRPRTTGTSQGKLRN